MGRAYSDDLRSKFLEAYEGGAGSLSKLADQFRVSLAYGKKIRGQQKRTGKKERQPQSHHGPISRVTETGKGNLRNWLQQQPDLTEVELCGRLQASGINLSRSRMGQVLRTMGLRRKKNPSMRKNATLRPTNNGGMSSAKNSARFRRSG